MNQLLYNFFNEIEDANKIKEMSIEEFTKIVKSNKLISDEDAKQLIESFKKISSKKAEEEDANDDADQRKKKYRQQQKETEINNETKLNKIEKKEREDDFIER